MELKLKGNIWVLTDKKGNLIDDIDTDQIYHNAYLHITEIEEMGKYALGNLEGWEDFSKKAKPGDIIIAGANFGAGSSRQQAVDCFKALGISAIIAESFGAIYKRNAINSAFPILTFDSVKEKVKNGELETGDLVEIDLETAELKNLTKEKVFKLNPFSTVQKDIYLKGSLFKNYK